MALTCVVCRSDECLHLGDLAQCRSCNAHFNPVTGEVATTTFGGTELPTPEPPAPPPEAEPSPAVEPEPEPITETPEEVADGEAQPEGAAG